MALPATVLVVDDDPSIRLLCRVNLELEGHRVLEAATLEDALAQVAEADVLFVDLHIGKRRGRELVEPLRAAARPEARIVLLTGSAQVEPALRAEVAEVLGKPFTIESLVAAARGDLTPV
jgi:two-component system, NtrC family, nitrogen regulation response regulator NtrX